ncbi:MAG: GNAT family N-acetyltransferase [Pseudolabrys sp.]
MAAPPVFTVSRWTTADRLGDIMAMIYAAFGAFEPPSGVLKETVADLAARQRDGLVLVAQAGERFIGSLFCACHSDALYLTRLATAPDWRKRGVGRALIAVAESEARASGVMRLTLRVRKNLPGNRAYFERFGFAVTGDGADPGRPPYDAMELRLSQKHVVG